MLVAHQRYHTDRPLRLCRPAAARLHDPCGPVSWNPLRGLMDPTSPVPRHARFGEDEWDPMEGRASLPLSPAERVLRSQARLTGVDLQASPPRHASSKTLPCRPAAPRGATVRPLRQSNSVSCGQTSVAMSVNTLTGKRLTDKDIARRHGFSLLSALNSESRGSGYRWYDGGNFKARDWPALEKRLNKDHTPVIMGLNGPAFSPSGRGHIVTLLAVLPDGRVRYADPADGRIKTTSKRAIEQAPPHPDGKFFFFASR